MNKAVLDTDTLSAIMRQDTRALSQARSYLAVHPRLTISIITRFEILRGLCAKQAVTQIGAFDVMCQSLEILGITDQIIVRAAEIYGNLYRSGQLVGDADTLIAATSLDANCECVTNNTLHFKRIENLVVRNWLED